MPDDVDVLEVLAKACGDLSDRRLVISPNRRATLSTRDDQGVKERGILEVDSICRSTRPGRTTRPFRDRRNRFHRTHPRTPIPWRPSRRRRYPPKDAGNRRLRTLAAFQGIRGVEQPVQGRSVGIGAGAADGSVVVSLESERFKRRVVERDERDSRGGTARDAFDERMNVDRNRQRSRTGDKRPARPRFPREPPRSVFQASRTAPRSWTRPRFRPLSSST